jgi:hypothetical protein
VLGSFLELHAVAARLSHVPPPLAARGLTCSREKFQAVGGLLRLPPLFTSLSAVRVFITCKRIKHPSPLILIFFSFSDLFRSSPFQICFTVDLSLVYIFFSFASGGRQLGGDGARFRLLLWPLQLVAEGNGVDLWVAMCWLRWLTVWAALMGGGNEGKGQGEREANLF